VVICLNRGADLHTVQLMPLPLIVSCCSKICFTFLVLAHPCSPRQRAVKWVCVFSKLHFCKMTINILFRVLGIQILIILECVDLCLPTFLVTAAFALHSSYSALLPTLCVRTTTPGYSVKCRNNCLFSSHHQLLSAISFTVY